MRKNREVFNKIFFVGLLILPAVIIQFASHSPFVTSLTESIKTHLLLYIFLLLTIKTISIVYPPLPGAAFTIVSIPLIGWQLAYFVDILGSTIGATLAFLLGRKYGYGILRRVVGITLSDKIAKIKLKQKNQLEAAIFLRIASGGMLSDGLAWGASLIGFTYLPFIAGYIISHLITTLPIFYLLGASISFNSWILIVIAAIIAWLIIFKFKGRYFE